MHKVITPIADMLDIATLWREDCELQRLLPYWLLEGQHLRQAEANKGRVSTPYMTADNDITWQAGRLMKNLATSMRTARYERSCEIHAETDCAGCLAEGSHSRKASRQLLQVRACRDFDFSFFGPTKLHTYITSAITCQPHYPKGGLW